MSDQQTISVAELEVGDFVVMFPAQAHQPARSIKSAVASLDDSFGSWVMQSAPRRPKLPVRSRVISFVTRAEHSLDVPADFEIIVRRAS